jgi:hypothetical protein
MPFALEQAGVKYKIEEAALSARRPICDWMSVIDPLADADDESGGGHCGRSELAADDRVDAKALPCVTDRTKMGARVSRVVFTGGSAKRAPEVFALKRRA